MSAFGSVVYWGFWILGVDMGSWWGRVGLGNMMLRGGWIRLSPCRKSVPSIRINHDP